MRKQGFIFILNLLMSLLSLHANAVATPVYAQLSSSHDQLTTVDTLNQGIVCILENYSSIDGMSFDPKKNEISVQEDGVYFIMVVGQMGAREYAKEIVKGGDIYFWMEMNDKPIENSGSWVFASPTARAHTIVDNVIISCKKGDRILSKFSTSSPSMGLITFDATEKWPASPGLTLSIFKLN
jgi:hypothetical protein